LRRLNEPGRVLAPFQNRRYEPHFNKVKEIVASGKLGQIVQIRMAWHSFGRRWDWQTLREFGGGQLANNGPHLLDQALGCWRRWASRTSRASCSPICATR
jgi:predicted dehydrogenase